MTHTPNPLAWFVHYKYREVVFEHVCEDEAQAREIEEWLNENGADDRYLSDVSVRLAENYIWGAERNGTPAPWATVSKVRTMHQTLIKESAGEDEES